MAEGKNKIVVYADWKDSFEYLTDEEAGKLIKHFFKYVNDENPILEDRLLKASWIPIEKTLKRDLNKWNEKSDERSDKARKAGLASAEARKLKKQLDSTNELKVELKPTKSTVNDSVSVSDSVNNKDNDVYMNELVKNKQAHGMFLEGIYMRHKIKKGSLGFLVPQFNTQLNIDGKVHENLKEYKNHLGNWMNKQEQIGTLKEHKIR